MRGSMWVSDRLIYIAIWYYLIWIISDTAVTLVRSRLAGSLMSDLPIIFVSASHFTLLGFFFEVFHCRWRTRWSGAHRFLLAVIFLLHVILQKSVNWNQRTDMRCVTSILAGRSESFCTQSNLVNAVIELVWYLRWNMVWLWFDYEVSLYVCSCI